MQNKLVVAYPVTQTRDAVESLLKWKGVASDPLPEFVEMGDGDHRLVLVLSNKKDAYYVVTPTGCSCPAATYHPGQPCKHQRRHFTQPTREAEPTLDLVASLPGWRGPDGLRANGPVEAI